MWTPEFQVTRDEWLAALDSLMEIGKILKVDQEKFEPLTEGTRFPMKAYLTHHNTVANFVNSMMEGIRLQSVAQMLGVPLPEVPDEPQQSRPAKKEDIQELLGDIDIDEGN